MPIRKNEIKRAEMIHQFQVTHTDKMINEATIIFIQCSAFNFETDHQIHCYENSKH